MNSLYSKRWSDLPLILIEIAIFLIVFANTEGLFLDIIIMSKGKRQNKKVKRVPKKEPGA